MPERQSTCPICRGKANLKGIGPLNQQYSVKCIRCGDFLVTDRFDDTKPELSPSTIANASGWISENQGISLKEADWSLLEKLATPSVGEKADKLLLYLARKSPKPGSWIAAETLATSKAVSACWAIDEREVQYLRRLRFSWTRIWG